jgi:hypothetical protein
VANSLVPNSGSLFLVTLIDSAALNNNSGESLTFLNSEFMSFSIELTEDAEKDIEKFKKTGNKKILQKIDIMPILYPLSQTNTVGSGVFYSCLTNEISMIIPKDSIYLKKILKFSSYEEAEGINEYVEKTILMIKNYDFYLNEAKKQSLSYKSKIKFDPLVKNIIKNDFN